MNAQGTNMELMVDKTNSLINDEILREQAQKMEQKLDANARHAKMLSEAVANTNHVMGDRMTSADVIKPQVDLPLPKVPGLENVGNSGITGELALDAAKKLQEQMDSGTEVARDLSPEERARRGQEFLDKTHVSLGGKRNFSSGKITS